MAGEIKINYDAVANTKQTLISSQQELTESFQTLQQLTKELSGTWKGDSQSDFDTCSDAVVRKLINVMIQFHQLSQKLDFAVQEMRDKDTKIAAK